MQRIPLLRLDSPGHQKDCIPIHIKTGSLPWTRHRQAGSLNEPGTAIQAWKHRYFECHTQADGSLLFEGQVPAEIGAMLQQALDRAMAWANAQECQECQDDSAESSDVTIGNAEPADRYLLTVHAPETALPLRAQGDASAPPSLELSERAMRRKITLQRGDSVSVMVSS